MAAITLRVRAKAPALCQNYEALESGVKRFIGWKASPAGFEATGDVESVPMRAEYVQAVKDGDLEAADDATATACGVALQPAPAAKKGNE